MPIVDADVHISPYGEGNRISADEAVRRMDRSVVDKGLCWLQPPYLKHLEESNEYVFQAGLQWPDRIIGFGWANPRLGVGKAKETVRKCVEEYGFPGVKLNGAQDGYPIDDPEVAMPVIEQIAAAGKVLAFHVGADAFENTHPFRVAKIAEAFPATKILMVHMGGVGHADLTRSAIEFASRHPNLFLIGSAVRSSAILAAIDTLGADRVCFGSDTPFEPMHVEAARYQALLGDLPEQARQRVMGRNILRILGRSENEDH